MKRRIELVFVLFFFSGLSGLIYESVWSQYVKLFLGHAAYAQTLVLIVFIGGLAGGSWLCGRVAERIRNPLRVYAFVEGAIGLMALGFHRFFAATIDWAFASLLPASCEPAATVCASQWALSALMLAPQSILLGMSFPLVSSAVLRMSREDPGHDIASLYFLNSLGAVMGVLASAFVLIPAVGLPGTLVAAGLVNLAVAIAAYAVSKTVPQPLAVAPLAASRAEGGGELRLRRILLATALVTGLSSFLYEIGWIRMLSLVLGSSTQSFELMLASFILGLALGGAWVRRRVDAAEEPIRLLGIVQLLMGLAAAATIPIYNGTFDFMAWLLWALARNDAGFVLFSLSSTLIALLIMLPATFFAGMTLPLITYRLLRSPTGEKSLGLVYAVNTLGSIVGVALAVHLLMPLIGVGPTVVTGAAIDVMLGAFLLLGVRDASGARVGAAWQPVAALALLAVMATLFHIDPRRSNSGVFRTGSAVLNPNFRVPFSRDGKTASVTVLDSDGGIRSIRTNGKPDASLTYDQRRLPTEDEYTMAMLAVLPMGYRPEAKRAAVIGFGSGTSTALLLASPNLERVDTVEIEPAMVEGAQLFRPIVDAAFTDPRSHIVIDDAKSYFARGRNRYDIIVSEPSNPWVSGVASLFSAEFYARLSGYLENGGVLAQWLHTYEMDAATLSSILAAVSQTFPDYVLYTANDADLVLIARKGGAPGKLDPRVLAWPKLQRALERIELTDPVVVERRAVGTSNTVGPFFRSWNSPANSDYFPFVDRHAAVTRFRADRLTDLLTLQSAAVPMVEMLDGSGGLAPSAKAVRPIVPFDRSVALAQKLEDIIVRGSSADSALDTGFEVAARLMHPWLVGCEARIEFAQMFPSLLSVASSTTPFLGRKRAGDLWDRILESPCLARIGEDDRRWLLLLAAIARRDPEAMHTNAAPILAATAQAHTDATELALLADATALLCSGKRGEAKALLDRASVSWMRRDSGLTELRYLRSLAASPKELPATASCSFGRGVSAPARSP